MAELAERLRPGWAGPPRAFKGRCRGVDSRGDGGRRDEEVTDEGSYLTAGPCAGRIGTARRGYGCRQEVVSPTLRRLGVEGRLSLVDRMMFMQCWVTT